jgi:hypothetical protein
VPPAPSSRRTYCPDLGARSAAASTAGLRYAERGGHARVASRVHRAGTQYRRRSPCSPRQADLAQPFGIVRTFTDRTCLQGTSHDQPRASRADGDPPACRSLDGGNPRGCGGPQSGGPGVTAARGTKDTPHRPGAVRVSRRVVRWARRRRRRPHPGRAVKQTATVNCHVPSARREVAEVATAMDEPAQGAAVLSAKAAGP